ncbi:MAG: phosphatidylserine decarboxylase family protein [Ignavibacteria bacterium]|nr:phosphatidylserine decarboxylase family protein [Ignavibacteria bacterium]MBI3765832.1 phosphatidylserine decarboxylase family protein [Ignavibacteriales bacterium]
MSKYGIDVVVKFFLIAVVIVCLTFIFADTLIVRYTITGCLALLTVFVLNFFRDPDRVPPHEKTIVVSPADGKVVQIKELFEGEYLKSDAVQVSIFMSPLNVHVNRLPMSGTVGYFEHIPGEYGVAFDDKSSDRNERTLIGIEREGYKILFKQVAGTIARRIVADLRIGQQATIGERFGMIKFGSRVDVIMPKLFQVAVHLNDRVVAGESILARYAVAPKSIE